MEEGGVAAGAYIHYGLASKKGEGPTGSTEKKNSVTGCDNPIQKGKKPLSVKKPQKKNTQQNGGGEGQVQSYSDGSKEDEG